MREPGIHSQPDPALRILKIGLIIIGSIVGLVVVCTICYGALLLIGMGGTVLAILAMLQQLLFGPTPQISLVTGSTPPSMIVTANINWPPQAITPTISPIILPTETITTTGEEWSWRQLGLYDKMVELPESWLIIEINRRPEPTGIGEGIGLGHDCADYQLSDHTYTATIDVIMPCSFGDGEGPPVCADVSGINFVEPISDTQYLINQIDEVQGKIYYGLADYGLAWTGETTWTCSISEAIYYFEIGRKPSEYVTDPAIINRIIISMLTPR